MLLVLGIASAVLSVSISYFLVHRLEKFFTGIEFSVVGIGLLSALAADTPEITSAVTAVIAKQPDIGVGVIIGSNIFNFAALLGLPVLLNKTVTFQRNTLFKLGLLATTNALFAIFVGFHLLPGLIWFLLSILAMSVYVVFISDKRLSGNNRVNKITQTQDHNLKSAEKSLNGRLSGKHFRVAILQISVAVLLVISMSVIAEHSFADLGHNLGLSQAIIGDIILAVITSLPNAVAALYLAKNVSGDALISEAINSNTINVIAGILLPAAVFSSSATALNSNFLLWLNMIILTGLMATLYISKRITPKIAVVLILVYVGFVVYVAA